YPSGLSGARIPLAARILSVVDRFDEIRYAEGADSNTALRVLSSESGGALDPDLVAVFLEEVTGDSTATRPPNRVRPAGLTDREVEILRLIARGLSRRDIAEQLVLSEH